ncbi:reverse transcriptase domain-containing protein [Tanacetum coccineum]
MEENGKPVVQHQRRVNPKIHEVIKQEVIKLLDAGLIYPISDSPWVSPVHCVPKKGGITVVKNEENELIPTRLVTGWRVCIDYRKLNDATRKDHFPLPFMDQMLERLAGNEYYCFLDGFSGYFQIPIEPLDKRRYSSLPLRDICLSSHAFWVMQCTGHVPKGKKLLTFSKLATVDPLGDTTVLITPLKRYSIQFKAKFRNVMRCHKTLSKFAKSLTCGALILWGHSRLQEGTNIYSWPLIIYQNGLKQKHPTMTTELSDNFLKSSLRTQIGAPRAIISDSGTHFCNDQFASMFKYGVTHRLSTAYHSTISGQVERETFHIGTSRSPDVPHGQRNSGGRVMLSDLNNKALSGRIARIVKTPVLVFLSRVSHP